MTEPAHRLRVLVVEPDHLLMPVIAADRTLDPLRCSASGAEAVQAVALLKPDVVTIDEHPGGLDTVRQIMRDAPVPIVMTIALETPRGHTLEQAALAAGAVAVHDRSSLAEPTSARELLRLVKSMASVRLVRRRREARVEPPPLLLRPTPLPRSAPPQVVAIGASTGGPHAICSILAELPPTFPIPILVVQHTTSGYIGSLVDWLGAQTRLPVRVAAEGDALYAGGVWLAPTDRHLVVHGRHLALLDTPPCSLHRPSANVLFRSVAATYGSRAVGILLTGMGDDGALGLREMRQTGALTIAQDDASCVVFGMPAEAIRLGAASRVLPPSDIAGLLREQAAIPQGRAA
jgi:two-component system, chemotaxis family, protein-glutamate methylesterase/glutaminase